MPKFKPSRIIPKRFAGVPTPQDTYELPAFGPSDIAPYEIGLNTSASTLVVNFGGVVKEFDGVIGGITASTFSAGTLQQVLDQGPSATGQSITLAAVTSGPGYTGGSIVAGYQHTANLSNMSMSSLLGGYQNAHGTNCNYSAIIGGATNTFGNTVSSCAIIGGQNGTIQGSTTMSVILGGFSNQIASGGYGCLVSGYDNGIGAAAQNSAIIAGRSSTISGASTGTVVIGCDSLNDADQPYTTYVNDINVQRAIQLKPLTLGAPSPAEGKMFFSAGTGLFICTGSTDADWVNMNA